MNKIITKEEKALRSTASTRIKELRTSLKLTQEDFAERIHCSKEKVVSAENKNRLPTLDMVAMIADEFNVSFEWLYGRKNPKNNGDAMLNILLCLYKVLKIKTKKYRCVYKSQSELGTVSNAETVEVEDNVLCVAKEFADYIRDIQDLERTAASLNFFDDNMLQQQRKKIQEKHKKNLRKILELEETDIEYNVIIGDIHSLVLFDGAISALGVIAQTELPSSPPDEVA